MKIKKKNHQQEERETAEQRFFSGRLSAISDNDGHKLKQNPWFLLKDGFNPNKERIIETILSISNGFIGTRNSLEECYTLSDLATFVSGVYQKESGPDPDIDRLVKAPDWTRIQVFIDGEMADLFNTGTLEHCRYLDLRRGFAYREWRTEDNLGRITTIKTVKFVSLASRNKMYKSICIKPENYSGRIKVAAGIDGSFIENKIIIPDQDEVMLILQTKGDGKLLAMGQKSRFEQKDVVYHRSISDKKTYEVWEWAGKMDQEYLLESIVFIASSVEENDPLHACRRTISALEKDSYESAKKEHISTWEHRWNNSGILIDGDTEAQKRLNFALYHLNSAGQFSGNHTSIGARALVGESYQGHVFWDTEIYLLPFFTFTAPEIARALLMYRYNTLDGARENAKQEGHKGACYAWESTSSGLEMTPTEMISPYGETIPIYSSLYEIHITPDIAYAIWQYWEVTHDESFLLHYGSEIIFESSRFCEGYLEKGEDSFYHIHDVVGPDEYHERINDNAYTNIMARYNLEIGIQLAAWLKEQHPEKYRQLKEKINLEDSEICRWNDIKDNIYTSYQPDSKLYEQFNGYFGLDHINLNYFEPRAMAIDVLIGRERVRRSQVIKQADVLMFLFLLPQQFSREVIEANYNFYEPKTAHGSSLSPSIHSILAARLGKTDLAFKYFDQNTQIDLNDNMENAAGGIHIASIGGTWMTIVMGFAGMYIYEDGLLFDPHLPPHWEGIHFPLQWRKQKINVSLTKDTMLFEISGDQKINISVGHDNWRDLAPNNNYEAYYKDNTWQWKN